MPLPEDAAPGRALELAEELGRVAVVSPNGISYALRTDRRHALRHAVLGGVVGWWVAGPLALLVPMPYSRLVVVFGLVVGAVLWPLRFPPRAVRWVQVDRFTPEEEVGGTVAWAGLSDPSALPGAVDELVAHGVRVDHAPTHGCARVRLRGDRGRIRV